MCGFVNIIFGYLYILNSFEYSEFVYVLLQKTYWTPIFFREVDRHTVPVQFSEENINTGIYDLSILIMKVNFIITLL